MTTADIEKVQILATTKDGQHIMAISDDKVLIQCIAAWCQFFKLKDELFEQVPIKDYIEPLEG